MTDINKLQRILNTRIKFMVRPWVDASVEILKTKVRITFSIDAEDFRGTEYPLNNNHTMDDIIADQQRKLGIDVVKYVGSQNMDELLEVLVG